VFACASGGGHELESAFIVIVVVVIVVVIVIVIVIVIIIIIIVVIITVTITIIIMNVIIIITAGEHEPGIWQRCWPGLVNSHLPTGPHPAAHAATGSRGV